VKSFVDFLDDEADESRNDAGGDEKEGDKEVARNWMWKSCSGFVVW